MLLNRILIASLLIPGLIYLILFGETASLIVLCGAIVIMLMEFYTILGTKVKVKKLQGVLLGVAVPVTLYFYQHNPNRSLIMSALSAFTIIFFISRRVFTGQITESISTISYTIFGIAYISFLFSHLLLLLLINNKSVEFLGITLNDGRVWLYIAFSISIISDAAAFFIGKMFGRHTLAANISPKKTVEGFYGSIIGGIFLSFWIFTLNLNLSLSQSLFLGIFGSIIGQLGDLSASMFKRDLGVKDSGTLLMSHGGLLDRCDSIIFVAPFVYYFARLFG